MLWFALFRSSATEKIQTQDTEIQSNLTDSGLPPEPAPDTAVDESEDTSDTDTSLTPQIVRFIAMGDGGEGNQAQADNSLAIESICQAKTDSNRVVILYCTWVITFTMLGLIL